MYTYNHRYVGFNSFLLSCFIGSNPLNRFNISADVGVKIMKVQRKSAIAYLFRNFWQLVLVSLPAAVLLGFFVTPSDEITFMQSLARGELTLENYFGAYANAYSALRLVNNWWVIIISFVLVCFTFSVLIVKIDRHMRVGEMVAFPLKRSFALFPLILAYVFIWFLASEIANFVGIGLMYIFKFINNVGAVVSIGVVSDFMANMFVTGLFFRLIITIPLKVSENYRLNIALSYSARCSAGHKGILWGLTFGYVWGRYAVMCLGYLLMPFNLDVLVYALAYLFCIAYIPCLSYKLYHDTVGGERRDISEIIFY